MYTDTVYVFMSNASIITYTLAALLHQCPMKTERDQNIMLLFLRPLLLRLFFFKKIVELLLLVESKNVALTYLTTFLVVFVIFLFVD